MSEKTEIPARAQRCTTHFQCDCMKYRYDRMRKTLKVISVWAQEGIENKHIVALCDKALEDV